jgi:hypothetical protein
MKSAGRFTGVILLLVPLGCARDQDYLDVIKDRQAAMEELVATLESIKDAASMADARRTLEANSEKYEAIARRAEALPKPPPSRVKEQMQVDAPLATATMQRAGIEAKRISQLPGGVEFLKQFQATKGLLSAVQK